MKPVAFDYARPASVAEAVRMLAASPDAKVLAEALAEEGQRIKDSRLAPTGTGLRAEATPEGHAPRERLPSAT